MDGAPPAGRQIPLMTRGQATPESDRRAGLSSIVTETGAGDIFTGQLQLHRPGIDIGPSLVRGLPGRIADNVPDTREHIEDVSLKDVYDLRAR